MILEVFKKHNEQIAALVGQEYAAGTLERYETALKHTRYFLESKYKLPDIDVTKLNFEFISEYEFWLKSVRKCGHNTTMKYLSNFKKIVRRCINYGWIQRDPFTGYKLNKKEVNRVALTETEIKAISEKDFNTNRLTLVRDIFLFSCYTGLAYIDVKKLKRSDIVTGVDGEKWVITNRQKTDTTSRIPLLLPAITILQKYESHGNALNKDLVLPVLSNQKMNAYLKEIADLCGIKKELSYHIARHTFATTVTLSNGVPIETVSKMLGHTNLKTTQQYAKILDLKNSKDMLNLKIKLQQSTPGQIKTCPKIPV
jgi:site-specific recombinase XerD